MWPGTQAYEDSTLTLDDDAPADEVDVLDEGPVDDGEQLCADDSEIDPHVLQLIREVEDPFGSEKFERKAPPTLPQPDRARSVPNLPKVKSSAFKRILR
ncbi:MAG: hypothetical protein ABTQ32_04635 [Myxococcaceae bacterium]